MTATEFRDKKTREIQELFEKLSSLEESNLSPEMKGPSLSHLSAPNRKTVRCSGQSRARATCSTRSDFSVSAEHYRRLPSCAAFLPRALNVGMNNDRGYRAVGTTSGSRINPQRGHQA
jgi:hypothetical protein